MLWFDAQLTPQVVMEELFTEHTTFYPRVKESLLHYLFKHWKEMRDMILNRLKASPAEEKMKHYWLVEAVIEKSTME